MHGDHTHSHVALSPNDFSGADGQSIWSSDVAVLTYIALATLVAHVITGRQYGFHRDELATLDDSRRLAWGYIAYPPITPFFGRVSLALFGTSLAGFRFFAALVDAGTVLLTGLMAREMGGRRGAQLVAAFATIPFCLGAGALMQYVSFDYFFWVLAAYSIVRVMAHDEAKWWVGVGCAIGFGMMSKYTMGFLVAGIVVGVVLTDVRRFLRSKWLWYGVAISVLIFLPNLIWQAQHHFVSLDFLKEIHARDIRIGRTDHFIRGQLILTLLAFPLAMAGLYFCFFSRESRPYRILGWMFVTVLGIFLITKARAYYLAPAYPMLYAVASVRGEKWLSRMRTGWAGTVRGLAWSALALDLVVAAALTLPMAPINSGWFRFAVNLNGDYRDEIGWPEFVQTVAQIRDSLPAAERAQTAVLSANYGEAGAINLLGSQYGLPPAISGGNSFWAHGYGDFLPGTVIVTGFSRRFVDHNFDSCQPVAKTWNYYGVKNEETQDHPEIYVCRGLKQSWPDFWKTFQYFG